MQTMKQYTHIYTWLSMRLLPALLHFVKLTSSRYNIDESHSIGHAMDVVCHAQNIVYETSQQHRYIREQEPIIYTAAILHDMCDKKYVDPLKGVREIDELLYNRLKPYEIKHIINIITTMSYSTVKQNGFPDLGDYTMAYHIVREADLLAGYDFKRAMIYRMYKSPDHFMESFENSKCLFEKRVFRHEDDGLFITEYSKAKSKELYLQSCQQIKSFERVIDSYEKYI
jgi:HD superfamily phosphodiesterase